MAAELLWESCPECAAAVPNHVGYVKWCDACGWGLRAQEAPPPRTLLERIVARHGDATNERVFQSVMRSQQSRKRITPATIGAYALAVLIHLVTLSLVAGGIFLIVTGWPRFWMLFWAVCLLGIAWLLRPRIVPYPKNLCTRAELPTLFAVCDRVAAAAGFGQIHGIRLDGGMGVVVTRCGLRRRPVLSMGLQFFDVLNDPERVALVAYGITMIAGGSPPYGGLTGHAVQVLERWHGMLVDMRGSAQARGIAGAVMILVRWMLTVAVGAVWGLMYVLQSLTWYDAQYAHYMIDYRTAEIAGRDATLRMLDKLQLKPIIEFAQQRATMHEGTVFFDELHRQVAALPPREWQRMRRVSLMSQSRWLITYPPTMKRMAFLNERHFGTAAVTISPDESATLRRELASHHERVGRSLVDRYRSSLYRR